MTTARSGNSSDYPRLCYVGFQSSANVFVRSLPSFALMGNRSSEQTSPSSHSPHLDTDGKLQISIRPDPRSLIGYFTVACLLPIHFIALLHLNGSSNERTSSSSEGYDPASYSSRFRNGGRPVASLQNLVHEAKSRHGQHRVRQGLQTHAVDGWGRRLFARWSPPQRHISKATWAGYTLSSP